MWHNLWRKKKEDVVDKPKKVTTTSGCQQMHVEHVPSVAFYHITMLLFIILPQYFMSVIICCWIKTSTQFSPRQHTRPNTAKRYIFHYSPRDVKRRWLHSCYEDKLQFCSLLLVPDKSSLKVKCSVGFTLWGCLLAITAKEVPDSHFEGSGKPLVAP